MTAISKCHRAIALRGLRSFLLLLLCGLGAIACGDGDQLGGTLEDELDLRFDRVSAYWLNDELIVAYERDEDAPRVGENLRNQPARLQFMCQNRALAVDEDIFYLGRDEPKGLLLDHYVIREDRFGVVSQEDNFPPYENVWIRFSRLGREVGEEVVGEFNANLQGNEILWGDFHARLRTP